MEKKRLGKVEPLYKPLDISIHLSVKPGTVMRLIRSGELYAVKLGRQWRVKESDLQAYIDSLGGNDGIPN